MTTTMTTFIDKIGWKPVFIIRPRRSDCQEKMATLSMEVESMDLIVVKTRNSGTLMFQGSSFGLIIDNFKEVWSFDTGVLINRVDIFYRKQT